MPPLFPIKKILLKAKDPIRGESHNRESYRDFKNHGIVTVVFQYSVTSQEKEPGYREGKPNE